ncbi:MAG: hypothetical protein KHX59_08110 [Prevotella sp.]|nr:hypothetical protein [Prevotella sp.]
MPSRPYAATRITFSADQSKMTVGTADGGAQSFNIDDISTVKATTASGKDVAVTLDIPYGSFVMPAEDVTVTVTYEDISSEDKVTVIAHFDEDQYSVRSSTNYDWNFKEGFTVDKDSTFYMTVYDNYGENFYVGVKIGDNATTYPATMDEDSGEYSFGKAFVASGNMVIKVGPTESSVAF